MLITNDTDDNMKLSSKINVMIDNDICRENVKRHSIECKINVQAPENENSSDYSLPLTRNKRRLADRGLQSGDLSESTDCLKKQKSMMNELTKILRKDPTDRTNGDISKLSEFKHLIPEAQARIKRGEVLKQRTLEQEESQESIIIKAELLATLLKQSNHPVIYTGAGISTSALIPDYRGPNGLWTQLKKTGTYSITNQHDLSTAEPTFTHMAISELCKQRFVKHVVSQNCDGLHLRSGVNQKILSEIHGNMYIEVCLNCNKQYYRQADITEKTSRFKHKTGRKCHICTKEPANHLIDTIVLYGERSRVLQPMNWTKAGRAAEKSDLIICMGSSLKTLRHYDILWPKKSTSASQKSHAAKLEQKPKLVIINLQYTSKDKSAFLKINGKCDLVMSIVMQKLGINVPSYSLLNDPLRALHIPFSIEEKQTLNRNLLFERGILPFVSDTLIQESLADKVCKVEIMDRNTARNEDERCQNSNALSNIDTKNMIPGWLGKSLVTSKTIYNRRKRHGNKGKSRVVSLDKVRDVQ